LQRILSSGQADQTINKSRFIALAAYCDSERAAAIMLRGLISQHPHAHHLAYAYKIRGPEGILQRFHDAGEPSGTAGKPIMQYLEGHDLINACVGVIRYYGGINLGTGGLARAYGSTAKLALDAAKLGPFVEMRQIKVTLDYAKLDHFTRDLGKLHGEVLDKDFGERVTVIASVPIDVAAEILGRFAGK
jgi:uncharacterized YigZ family protein